MNSKICRYCFERPPSSKEHLIADRRLSRIKSFKEIEYRNNNIRKTFKKITCETCNKELGRYEDRSLLNLAYSTVWKILAGNINLAFFADYHKLKNSDISCIAHYESELLSIVKDDKAIMPFHTFYFDFDPASLPPISFHTAAVKNIKHIITDEAGNPIERAKVFFKDKAGSESEAGCIGISDSQGIAELGILMCLESVYVVPEVLWIENISSDEIISKVIDFIIYISFDSNRHRLIVILPIFGSLHTSWPNANIRTTHKDFFSMAREYVREIKITSLRSYFPESAVSFPDSE